MVAFGLYRVCEKAAAEGVCLWVLCADAREGEGEVAADEE